MSDGGFDRPTASNQRNVMSVQDILPNQWHPLRVVWIGDGTFEAESGARQTARGASIGSDSWRNLIRNFAAIFTFKINSVTF